MISPRLNFSLIKAKFHGLAPAIKKGAGFRQRRSYLIHSSPAVLGRPRPCWFGKLIPEVSSPHMVSISSLSAELVRFWNGPLLQDSAWTGPAARTLTFTRQISPSRFSRGCDSTGTEGTSGDGSYWDKEDECTGCQVEADFSVCKKLFSRRGGKKRQAKAK